MTDSDASTDSTRCASDASDSMNSLIAEKTIDNCIDVKCSLVEQCPVSCEDSSPTSEGRRKNICCNTVAQCVWGLLLLFLSVSGFVYTPLDVMLREKLNMRPGFPPYEWWADPPDEVRLRVYVFNVTNHDRFMEGLDKKINVVEIGPIVYLEKLLHSNIVFNENSTLTYTAKRYPIYLPDQNAIDLNATLVVPNLALLGLSSYLHDANYFVLTGFRFLASSHHSQVFVKKTIYEYLWDYRETILDTSKNLAPGLVPVNNMGMLARMYSDFTDEVTVKIGAQWGDEKFFQIDRFRGAPQLPGYDPNECPDRIFGSSEGVMYHQRLTKSDVVLYWRKSVCKIMPLYFDRLPTISDSSGASAGRAAEGPELFGSMELRSRKWASDESGTIVGNPDEIAQELVVDNVPVYRYNLSESVYERVTNGTDCYDTDPSLPAGLSDGSKCYFDFPMVVSYPHFYNGQPPKDMFVTGLKPDRSKHNSYVVVEPLTGTPFRSVARMQSNLRIHDLSRFNHPYNKFSNLVLPLFWAEYNQEGLPGHIRNTIYFMAVILPPLSYTILVLTLLLGSYLIARNVYKYHIKSETINSLLQYKSKNSNLAKNNILIVEKEAFLKVPS